ncbi:hypothetical protein Pcinc_016682 [Petrolisthes cinctipes]|uniref:Oplophorus-luciferin 2-monooxygenase non-catalytic subunit n=1 Tax=Petrolisthes cinctipes TaxID=88211 RepID=A0AAE1FQM0_PETCI|nr:hypothetical protein Pcinc_016682 [Petrolisthes cinctipes]
MEQQRIVTWVAMLCCCCLGTLAKTEKRTEQQLRALPCPNAADIAPCVCTVLPDNGMEMDCSSVTSSNELALVFSAEIPFLDFESLTIQNNDAITSLRAGDLGDATFRIITIMGGSLETVVMNAFMSSYHTLTDLTITGTKLNFFPFGEIESFTQLKYLNLENNDITGFPTLASATLRELLLGFNSIGEISLTSLTNLPSLVAIGLHSAEISQILPGTFAGLPMLQEIHLEMNSITQLPAGAIELQTLSNIVHLNVNLLEYIAEGALTGLHGEVFVQNNQLHELAEGVFKPLVDQGENSISLFAEHNPLACGCDIAWLVNNSKFLSHLMDDPTCSDGEKVKDLDPSIFILCP